MVFRSVVDVLLALSLSVVSAQAERKVSAPAGRRVAELAAPHAAAAGTAPAVAPVISRRPAPDDRNRGEFVHAIERGGGERSLGIVLA